MPRQLSIVGLGDAVLEERPGGAALAGLAARIAACAVRMGHRGIVVTRIGQDGQAADLMRLLEEAGIDTAHVQSDPDLATGRIIVKPTGDRVERYRAARVAFDNLQWDHDLEDVAQQADAVVFALLTRRAGQTRSEENRVLAACDSALKVFDLTHRDDTLERRVALDGLERADVAVLDPEALHLVRPGAPGRSLEEGMEQLRRGMGLDAVLCVESAGDARRLTVHEGDARGDTSLPAADDAMAGALVTLIDGALLRRGFVAALPLARRIAELAVTDPGAPVPAEWLDGTAP